MKPHLFTLVKHNKKLMMDELIDGTCDNGDTHSSHSNTSTLPLAIPLVQEMVFFYRLENRRHDFDYWST